MARSLVSCLVPCALITQLSGCFQHVGDPDAQATVVDRREGDWAVVQHLKDGRIERVPLSTLPADVRDGDVLVRNQRADELRALLLGHQRTLRASAARGSFSLEDAPATSPEIRGQRAAPAPQVTEVTQALTAEGER
ncbi:MAG TPA: DUF3006 domain-containing protein [Myxococcaceae bacterium]|nr:DUF3006 domain-containing protein [Myxococcaceae bacterium]